MEETVKLVKDVQVAIVEEGEEDLLLMEKPQVGGVSPQRALTKEDEEEKEYIVPLGECHVEMVEVTQKRDVILNNEATIQPGQDKRCRELHPNQEVRISAKEGEVKSSTTRKEPQDEIITRGEHNLCTRVILQELVEVQS